MDLQTIKQKIIDLSQKIKQWNIEYFDLNQPSVSDLEYDQCLYELEKLEQAYPQFKLPDSPTDKVGNLALNKFRKILHKKPMLSLSKAYNYDEIVKYLENIQKTIPTENINFTLEPKIDGLSISLHYQNGYLKLATTRGNGIEGEDVTDNIYAINSIPKIINYEKELEVRGEVFLPKSAFNKLNKEIIKNNEKPFANPRNAASGTLRQLDSKIVALRGLQVYLYELVDTTTHNIHSQDQALKFLDSLNIPTNKTYFKVLEIEELEEEIENFAELKNEFNYDCDGLVIKLNNIDYWSALGQTAKFPKHSIAFKYDVENAISKIIDIFPTVGRTGKITYVAQLEPVELNQTTVQAATLHNYSFIKNLNIDINDEVKIIKAGEIIPKVLGPIHQKYQTNYKKVEFCPSCHQKLIEIENNVDQFCVNKQCPEIIINSIYHFASRESLNIIGLGISTVKDLYNAGILKEIKDIFNLKNHYQTMLELEGYGELKINNLLSNIENAKKTSFDKALFALGIKHIGSRAAKLIAKKANSFSEMLEKGFINKLLNLNNFGPKMILSLEEFIKDETNQKLMLFLDEIFNYSSIKKEVSSKLNNLTFVITGKLKQSREHYVNVIENNGGVVSSSVSKNTNYLLTGIDAGSKLEKAKKLNIRIISEEEFDKMLN